MPDVVPPTPFWKRPVVVAVLFLGLMLGVGLVPLAFDARLRDLVYGAEHSMVEWASCLAWLALGLAFPFILRSRSRAAFAGSLLFLACAAREADLHIAFTGYSVLKPRFLLDSSFPTVSRLVVAAILATLAIAAVVGVRAFLSAASQAGGLRAPWVRVAVATPVAALLLKALDRVPALVRWTFGDIDDSLVVAIRSIEENFELGLPFGVLAAARMYVRSRTPAVPAAS